MNTKIYLLLLCITAQYLCATHKSYQTTFNSLYDNIAAYGKEPKDQEKLLNEFISAPDFNIAFVRNDGETILSAAVKNNQANVVKRLLSLPGYKAIIDQQDSYGYIPLYSAVNNRNKTIAIMLLEKGANPDASSKDGLTPLHKAVALQIPEFVKILLKFNANPIVKPTTQEKRYNSTTGTYEIIATKTKADDDPLEMSKKIVAHEIETQKFPNAKAKRRALRQSKEIFGLLYKRASELEDAQLAKQRPTSQTKGYRG